MSVNDVTVIIPSLNPDEKLVNTVVDLRNHGFDDIIIVDDGSDAAHKVNFPDLNEFTYCTIIHHRRNKGKGAALKTAFSFVLKHRDNKKGVITVDADGQHLGDDVVACAEKMLVRNKVVLGCRNFSEPQVPPKSRFGNKLTRNIMKWVCGVKISDTQTGLRAIPVEYLEAMCSVKGDRYEYETNMLIEFKKQGIPFCEVPISTVYLDENKGSHFRPIRDSLRVYKFILSFVMSSAISTLVELALFYIALRFLFDGSILISAVLARICSATVNFTINRTTVFASKAGVGKTLLRYIAVALPILLISAYSVKLITWALGLQSEVVITLIKALIDVLLFFMSYRFQQNWVFASKLNEKKSKKQAPQKQQKLTPGKIFARIGISVLSFVMFLVLSVFSLVAVVAYGPSVTIRDMLVLSAMQASATKWVPGLFLSDEEVSAIVNASHEESELILDPDSMTDIEGGDNSEVEASIDGMKYITANYSTFKAYILLVADPSRIYVGTASNNFYKATEGMRLFDMAKKEDCIAMINGGEFADAGGNGTGAAPIGLTYSNGKCVWSDGAKRTFIGIDNNNRLVVSEGMSKAKAEELGIRDAVCFQTGNVLINTDEEGVHIYYKEGNLGAAQRTAIGQRQDGTFIFVVTDGRSANSIGANYNEIIDIMVSYGAVTAAMLDGGSSAMMYYEDYYTKYNIDESTLDKYQLQGMVNKYKAFVPPRKIPTYFCIKR